MSNSDYSSDVIRLLLDLYGIAIALALTTAIGLTVSPNGVVLNPLELNDKSLALFGAFFITIVPFYHGASLYLLRTYKKGFSSSKRGAVLVDFFTLTLEGVVFYAMATSIQNLEIFIIWLIVLFILDIFWWGFTYFKSTDIDQPAPKWWPALNGVMILFLILITGIRVEYGYICMFLYL